MDEPIEIETGPNPQASVIVLHGLGASGDDFVPVCEQLDLRAVGPVRHVLPQAPMRPVTINGGYVMPAWYDIRALGGTADEDEAGLRASQALVEHLIAREVARGVSPSRIALAGFSQGCAMVLLTGLRHRERLAGIVGLSGYLPLAGKTAAERTAANQDTPIFLAHGRFDPMIALPRAQSTRDALRAFGYDVQWHEYPMEHAVCLPEIADLQQFLLQVLVR
ncbi:MAG TPA: dienelactone hydrolase family protein [Burkholderiaceae bacterium]|nr:dienelactone hydrolase family protein [Burkholderiaceae bacterium]